MAILLALALTRFALLVLPLPGLPALAVLLLAILFITRGVLAVALPAVFAAGFLLLLLLFVERFLHQLAIMASVLVAGVAGQCSVVGFQGAVEVAGVGEGVAPVVLCVAVVKAGEITRRTLIVARLQLGIGLAARVGESVGSTGGVALRQHLLRTLVGGLPEAGPVKRSMGVRRAEQAGQYQGDALHSHPRRASSAASTSTKGSSQKPPSRQCCTCTPATVSALPG